MSDKPLKVVLYWHMHQPEYRDLLSGQYFLPWTYLHVIKDYVDMVAHLETNPSARAVVNFTPTLLEQIDDYAGQIRDFLSRGEHIRDPLLNALSQTLMPTDREIRLHLIKQCLKANEKHLINRYDKYRRLAEFARWLDDHPDAVIYLHDQFLCDLLTWFHLAWLGETVRRENQAVQALIEKGFDFTAHDRRLLLELIGELCQGVIPRYRKLAESGQIELSVTPYAHPIMPLLQDISSAREAMPDAPLPLATEYPGGEERAQWHIDEGLAVFERYFGFKPAGCWPAEGSVSEPTVRALADNGFKWLASGDTVLHNSLNASGTPAEGQCIHMPYQLLDKPVSCFFRDDGLSDMIGFNYTEWHADDAVANLNEHLENIARACEHSENPVVSIILDGENAWEYYPENGYYFLSALYASLASNPNIELTTYSEYLSQQPAHRQLSQMIAGSWVYGTFSTWIGEPEKNKAWDLLIMAKRDCDRKLAEGIYDEQMKQRILQQMAICEGSDWFWWFGDYNPSESVQDFDFLYRLQLSNLYQLLGLEPPEELATTISHGGGHVEAGGTMRRGQEIH